MGFVILEWREVIITLVVWLVLLALFALIFYRPVKVKK